MAKLRTCKICGKQYEYCGHCPSKNVIEPWRNLYCSENCREAFQVMGSYSVGKISADAAKRKLEKYKISPMAVRDVHKPVVAEIFEKAAPKVEAEVVPAPILEVKAEEPIPVVEPKKLQEEKPVFHKNFKKKPRFQEKKQNIVNED